MFFRRALCSEELGAGSRAFGCSMFGLLHYSDIGSIAQPRVSRSLEFLFIPVQRISRVRVTLRLMREAKTMCALNVLSLDMKWSVAYYRLVESYRQLVTLVPARQYVKHVLPCCTFDIWPPSSIRRKKTDVGDGGGDGPEIADIRFFPH